MNFTLSRDFISPTVTLDGPTTSVLANDNRMDNITSIVDAFENGTILKTHGKNATGMMGVEVKRQLNDLLLWLNSDLIPCIINEATNNDTKQLNEYLQYSQQIRQRFGKVSKFIKQAKQRPSKNNYLFLCSFCKQVISPQVATNSSIWHSLQQHEHIEENLHNYYMLSAQPCHNGVAETVNLISSTRSSSPNFMTCTNNGLSVSEKQKVFALTSSSSSNDRYESPTNSSTSQNSSEIVPKQATNSSCSCAKNDAADFKFNFCVGNNSAVERKLYYELKFAKQIKEMDGLGLHTIQFKGPQLFSCLLCGCDVPSHLTFRSVKEHISGHRHTKRKFFESSVAAVVAYHQTWTEYEVKYQAHQVYFFPKNKLQALCNLCGSVAVNYNDIEIHINSDFHREQVQNAHQRERSYLTDLQITVYRKDEPKDKGVLNSQSDDSEEIPKETMHRSNQRLFANMDKAGSDTDDSDTNTSAADEKKSNSASAASKGNEKPSTAKAKDMGHNIIKSVRNPTGTELRDLLENRFLPHIESIMNIGSEAIECQACKVRMPKDPAVVKEHILTNTHKAKANGPHLSHRFFCEICGILIKQNAQWVDHMKQPRHVERCERLGPNRKSKITEHECLTCKMVIFGDDLSLRRHKIVNSRGVRYRKNKEIILGEAVKSYFKSEKIIQEHSTGLIAEANQVLLKQDHLQKCCSALEAALAESYPKCKVHPFGSRVSGLGSKESDLDLFVDVGGMYKGQKLQDSRSQEKFVATACKIFRKRKDEFAHVNPIPTARTPIIQVYHLSTQLDCDLSFRHGLSVENTKFLRYCSKVQPVTQAMILLLKQWLEQCKLHENITTYALSMMVIFFLQVKGHLMSVKQMRQFSSEVISIDGWEVVDFQTINTQDQIVAYNGPMKKLLMDFFYYYSCFSYTTDVVCPLLGESIRKSLFLDNPNDLPPEMLSYVQKLSNADSEQFRARSPFCIQDPFDLSHNLTKACTHNLVEKLKTLCDLTVKYLRISG